MPRPRPETLRAAMVEAGGLEVRSLSDATVTLSLAAIAGGTCLGGRAGRLAGRSVLIVTGGQLASALALIELDGLAHRILLCPPDLPDEFLPEIVRDAGIDALVCSDPRKFEGLGIAVVACLAEYPLPGRPPGAPRLKTEWLMLTSGTTGRPKIAVHTFAGLTGAIGSPNEPRPVWATFYDIRRYGGLQILLRAMLSGGSLVLSHPGEPLADHVARLAAAGVTHISGTPTHWRRALMSNAADGFAPRYVRLSGEIADQAILDALKAAYPQASIGHAYASTEAGVGFEVNDGREGFPESYISRPNGGVEMKIEDGSLRIRSNRMAIGYAGRPDLDIAGEDGFVDTGDMVEVRAGRCYFTGRRGGIINVGGLKVHPEEVETVINRHAAVRLSRVRPRKSPIIGAIVVADVVLKDGEGSASQDGITAGILSMCRASLPPHKIPAVINIVASIETTAGGKVARTNA
ncbi:fatty acid--CoA ligase family protein [soil metagenome]